MSTFTSQAMAPSRYPIGRARNVSTADSGVSIQDDHQGEKDPLYGDLRYYLNRKRNHWLFTRDIELARPLQQKFLAYEAEILAEIHDTEQENRSTHRQRQREMDGTTGFTRLSWRLYELKVRLCSKWTRYQLRRVWKRRHLDAKKKELNGIYVRAQTESRMNMLREVMYFAGEEGVDNGDDGAFVRESLLNYIVTGYDSIFPISRDLNVTMK